MAPLSTAWSPCWYKSLATALDVHIDFAILPAVYLSSITLHNTAESASLVFSQLSRSFILRRVPFSLQFPTHSDHMDSGGMEV